MLILARSKKWDWSAEVGGVGREQNLHHKATGTEPGRALRDSNPKFHPGQGVKRGDGAPETVFSIIIGLFFC